MPHLNSRLAMSALATACFLLTLFLSYVLLGPQALWQEELYLAALGASTAGLLALAGLHNLASASIIARTSWVAMIAFLGGANFPYVGHLLRGAPYLTPVALAVLGLFLASLWLQGLLAWQRSRRHVLALSGLTPVKVAPPPANAVALHQAPRTLQPAPDAARELATRLQEALRQEAVSRPKVVPLRATG
jgi:hypothetical protein